MSFGKTLFVFLIILLLGIGATTYLNHTYIKAEFAKMDPIPSKMGVYYKGYKLGSTSRLKISKDFKKTYLYITLNQRGLHLPKNIRVKIKKYDNDTKYVDIIYPRRPMIKYIQTGDTIKGDTGFIFSGISDINQAHIDDLSEKGGDLLSSAKKTTDSLTEMFDLVTDILSENRENILNSTTSLKRGMKNLEETTQNMKVMSQKANDGITKQNIQNSTKNIELMTSNFANSSKKFTSITENIDNTTLNISKLIPQVSKLIDSIQLSMCNINEIILGVKKTLQQRFGGARIIFGKPIKKAP